MTAKLECPICAYSMTLKTVKVGRFKPTCSKCKEVFVLEVTSVEPLKYKTSRLTKPAASTDATIEVAQQPNLDATIENPSPMNLDATIESPSPANLDATIESPGIQNLDVTIDAPGLQESKPTHGTVKQSAFDVTMESDLGKGLDVTMEGPATKMAGMDETVAPDVARSLGTMKSSVKTGSQSVLKSQGAGATKSPVTKPPSSKPSQGDFSVSGTSQPTRGATKSGTSAASASGPPIERLGGYKVLQELGRGGMGSVYLAKQISLDRSVALKTIQAEWAKNPRVIARFIREAYAAAQLTHHNVVQIYDLGLESGTNFFSMELVGGGSLEDLLKKKGKLEPKTAASLMLQAARGLKFAHDHGMVHRDIKPANLMLTNDGLVKIADLGLVKTPSVEEEVHEDDRDRNVMLASARSQVTGFGSTMGTPAYMSPEQADDATNVDHRADIYSLGCTFYALLTGRPPFVGNSALEMITKHKSEPIVRPERIVEGLPADLGGIIEKMTAKKPEDRYQDLSGFIADIEGFLGTDSQKPFTPSVEHATKLKQMSDRFHAAPMAKLRTLLPLGFVAFSIILAAVLALFSLRAASAALLMLIATPMAVVALSAFLQADSALGSRCRALLWESSWKDWLYWGIGAILILIIAGVLGLLPYWIGALIVSAGLAAAYQFIVLNALASQRRDALDSIESVLRELRVNGLPESSVQQFVAEFSGKNWEELFEQLFDYDSMRRVRQALASSGKDKGKKRFQPWRDALIDRFDARLRERRQEKEHRMLANVERASLRAAGMSDAEAKAQAEDFAATLVTVAGEARNSMLADFSFGPTDQKAAMKREKIKNMLAEARSGKFSKKQSFGQRARQALIAHLFGSKYRFLLGAFLVAGCALWVKQNGLLEPAKLEQLRQAAEQSAAQASEAIRSKNMDPVQDAQAVLSTSKAIIGETKPLSVFPWIDSFAHGIIGLLIAGSALVYGWRYSIFATAAALIVLLGSRLGIPSIGPVAAAYVSAGIAFAVMLIGLALGRMPADST